MASPISRTTTWSSTSTSLQATTPADARLRSRRECAGRARARRGLHRARASARREDSKFRALLQAVASVVERGRRGEGSGKLVIFTESLVTQDYLRELPDRERPVSRRGDHALSRRQRPPARAAGARALGGRGRRQATPRIAPSARHRGAAGAGPRVQAPAREVLISTEAGAKGLNLQFCDTVVNYDLPWNPQRIEQRIGRCHRYGQKRDVTVINFLAQDNEAAAPDVRDPEPEARAVRHRARRLRPGAAPRRRADAPRCWSAPSAPSSRRAAPDLRARAHARRGRRPSCAQLRDQRWRGARALRGERNTHGRAHRERASTRRCSGVFAKRQDELPGALAELDADLRATSSPRYLDAAVGAAGAGRWRRAGRFLPQSSRRGASGGASRGARALPIGAAGGTDESAAPRSSARPGGSRSRRATRARRRAGGDPRARREALAELVGSRGRRGRLRS